MAFVDGVGAAKFKGGEERAEDEEGEVDAGGDAEVLATLEIGEGAGDAAKGGELKVLGSGRCGLRGVRCG